MVPNGFLTERVTGSLKLPEQCNELKEEEVLWL
jgi:hypothetical protein